MRRQISISVFDSFSNPPSSSLSNPSVRDKSCRSRSERYTFLVPSLVDFEIFAIFGSNVVLIFDATRFSNSFLSCSMLCNTFFSVKFISSTICFSSRSCFSMFFRSVSSRTMICQYFSPSMSLRVTVSVAGNVLPST